MASNRNIVFSTISLLVMITGCSSHQIPCQKSICETPIYNDTPIESNIVMLISSNPKKDINQTNSMDTKGMNLSQRIVDSIDEKIHTTIENIQHNKEETQFATIYFDFNKFDIRSDMIVLLQKNSEIIKKTPILLEGNCDEFGSDEYNYALGLKRANEVKKELINLGINPNLIDMISYGESNPVCHEKTEECWAKNRRVNFQVKQLK